ncbi:MAG: glycosyltransferase family 2 protein [Bacteroidales bacterium]|nr:glycosyltransferase family 2 protein [Bacteroidales bacterium]MCM1147032.1 glycosyltransferase family 2 protein [Bacteroidales bacterium]MCM1205835.1 glycosyltransferase family 2 protein [Bacillota bacterium]MCM1509923.1 glycosyltransferase family 2 protein [Clostridium sp.]
MSKPTISIIIPLYNKEATVERSVMSVLNQSYKDIELIIVDDGSTDNSLDIVRKINDDRMSVYCQPNGGPGVARNTGVRNAHGDWIVFLDADDALLPDALEHFVNLSTNNHGYDIFDCGRYIQTGENMTSCYHPLNGAVKNPYKEWFYGRIAPGAGYTMFKRELLVKYPYDSAIRRYEDAEILIRMFETAKVYSSTHPVGVHNVDYVQASAPRKNISEDYLGHLNFKKKSFWATMLLYRLFLSERENYVDTRNLYSWLYKRYDWYVCYQIITRFSFLFN